MKLILVIIQLSMMFLVSCSAQKDQKRIYLAGWEAEFNGDSQCGKFMKTHVVDAKTARMVYSSIELYFEDNTLAKIYTREEGYRSERPLKDSEKGFQYVELTPHKIYELYEDPEAESYFGGKPPKELHIPKFDFNAPFQYLGKLSKTDSAFSWLPFDVHLVAPLYSNFYKLYFDYSDPMRPTVINVDELRKGGTEFEDLRPDAEIWFERISIRSRVAYDYEIGIAHTGVPDWIQYPDIPTCPKTNKTMHFLCQIHDENGISVERTNVYPKEEFYKSYFDHLNFYGGGDLYIFFEPDSKVLCMFIQIT